METPGPSRLNDAALTTVQVAVLVCAALVAGVLLGFYSNLDLQPSRPDTVRFVNVGPVPPSEQVYFTLGGLVMAFAGLLAVLSRRRPAALALYTAAIVAMLAVIVVTRLTNNAYNEVLRTWTPAMSLQTWLPLRDAWWFWQWIRLALAIVGFVLLTLAVFAHRSTRQ